MPSEDFDHFTDDDMQAVAQIIGRILLRLPLVAQAARHKRPVDTLLDYMDVDDGESAHVRAAKLYLKDLLGRGARTDNICAQWFGKQKGEST